ncbi:hypothetical protein PFLUV_G00077610 [Perca fluviatilis]|uniref:Uncharacterized protein n=1 Tax=Perca fluviatilis TaxID=8168 RepID=A0A6A5FDP4_PERFL|nr:uncharacterized protein LOC120560237 [Perca fluviatilis]KAF1389829.1 hypothetical protein PFLUV_G00077610 [Perca fluviatilis]
MDVVSMLRTVTKCLTDTTRNVVLHQLAVKSHKKARIISCEDLKRCQQGAKLRIPELLDALEENHTPSLRYRFYGYFAAFTASIYGYRPAVLSNLRVSEVEEAAEAHKPGDEGFVISIREHKTNKWFGAAQIFLENDEFHWLVRWLQLRAASRPPNQLVFFTAGRGPCKNFLHHLQVAWVEMGLKGSPNFTDLRTRCVCSSQEQPACRAAEDGGHIYVPQHGHS